MAAGQGAGLQRDMQALRAAVNDAADSFLTPQGLRAGLPALLRVIEAQQAQIQELRERYRAPCEGCGGGRRDEAGLMLLAEPVGGCS